MKLYCAVSNYERLVLIPNVNTLNLRITAYNPFIKIILEGYDHYEISKRNLINP